MKKITLAIVAAALAVVSCGDRHFITNKTYRKVVEADFNARANEEGLQQFTTLPKDITQAEKEALEFLYAYMPLADLTDYSMDFYLENVRESFKARREMGWDVPEREFRHFVLPLRVNNEDLDRARMVFYEELAPRVKGMSQEDAILEVNHWCHEKMTYQPSDGRTHSPLASLKNSLGRCGEESTFCVAALRAVGIPARQVYTPRWAHTESNHAWVEAWDGKAWRFLGACEPEPVLDLGWFNAPASRAMLTHTKVFGKYDGPEEVVLNTPGYTEINLIDRYAKSAKAIVKVVSAQGAPVEGARVNFCIYNSSTFSPAVAKYTDEKGETSLSAGLGDMLAWVTKDGNYGFRRIRFGEDTEVTVALDNPTGHPVDSRLINMVPPPEDVVLPEVSPELRAQNDVRMHYEDSVRKAYMATFPTEEFAKKFVADEGLPERAVRLVVSSAGNGKEITSFLHEAADKERAVALLESLSQKDLSDVSPEVLWDSYNAAESLLPVRIESEFLTPYKGWFLENVPAELQEQFRAGGAEAINKWVNDNITVDENPLFWDIPISPAGVWKSRMANPRSKNLLTAALARTFGAQVHRDRFSGGMDFGGGQVRTGNVKFVLDGGATAPEFFRNVSLSRIDGGNLRMTFPGMGGGRRGPGRRPGAHPGSAFDGVAELPEGDYLLASGNRLSDGSTPVTVTLFHVSAGETVEVPVTIVTVPEDVKVQGSFSPSLIPGNAGGDFAAAVLDVGLEPTNHVLRDIAEERAALEAWGRPIYLVATSEAQASRLQGELSEGRFGTLPSNVVFVTDKDGTILDGLTAGAGLRKDQLPVVIVGRENGDVVFASQGYTIGMGAKIAALAKKL